MEERLRRRDGTYGWFEITGTPTEYEGRAAVLIMVHEVTARRRSHRFSFAPILVVGFWALALFLLGLIPQPQGAVALVLAAAIVQLVSPWQPLPPPIMKRMRLRYT